MKKILLTSLMFIVIPVLVLAQTSTTPTEYTLLEPLPYVTTEGSSTTNAARYIEGIFQLTIGIAGVLAVLAIIFGGIKYMSTDAFGEKNEAKNTISNAIWGLALAMGAWLILNTINPNLTTFNLELDRQAIPAPSGPTGPGSGGGGASTVPLSCNNCVTIGVPVAPGNVCSGGGSCTINGELNSKLVNLNSAYSGDFEVTEAWPPTVDHRDSCHRLGTCVDIGLGLQRNRSPQNNPQNIINFINAANSSGLRAVFEVPNAQQRNNLISQGVPSGSIIVVSGISPHFSVYNN